MSWKIYSLGNTTSNKTVGEAAAAKLSTLGYEAICSATSDSSATLTVTIKGTQYAGSVRVGNTNSQPTYLCINDETDDILVCKYMSNASFDPNTQGNLPQVACFAIFSGTNAQTGETGLFPVISNLVYNSYVTNMWYVQNGTDVILMHRAIFRENDGYIGASFVTNLFWGSLTFAPGAIITVGTDNFVCLNQCLYAKL